jgi:hypothetical protein
MNWHAFIGAFSSPKLWYLPTAYAVVWAVQASYFGWVALRWGRTPRRQS